MPEETKKCPYCAEEIKADAVKCKHCGSMLAAPLTTPYDTLAPPLADTPTVTGRKLSNRYTVIKELGRGGMGVVYLAHDEELDMDVAVKFLPIDLVNDHHTLEQLRSEAKLSMTLSHPNIVRLHTLDTSGQFKFLVMEYLDGPSLLDVLRERERLPLDNMLPIIKAICEGLEYAHSKHVLHRDLKPANIMMTSKGEVKITDFGIARRMRESMTRLSQKTVAGTPLYMAPEHIMGEHLTVHSDIYSLGALAYELLAGHPPFYKGDILAQIRFKEPPPIIGIPEPVNHVILNTLSKDANKRPSTARVFYKALTLAILKVPPPSALVEEKVQSPQSAKKPAQVILAEGPGDPSLSWKKKREEHPEQPSQQVNDVQSEHWREVLKEGDAAYKATSWRMAMHLYAQVPEQVMNERQREYFASLGQKSLPAANSSRTRLRVAALLVCLIAGIVVFADLPGLLLPKRTGKPGLSADKTREPVPGETIPEQPKLPEEAQDAKKIVLRVPADFTTIQEAIARASDGDTILVANGKYTGKGNRDIDFKGKAIILESESGPAKCIIDCEKSGRGFYFRSSESLSSVVHGFTIQNGSVDTDGGGIRCANSSPSIINCIITENTASYAGGAIYCNQSDITISNCTLTNNSADNDAGGGLYCVNSSPWVINCTVADNKAGTYGGGIFCHRSTPIVDNTILWGNSASQGSQIGSSGNTSLMLNSCDLPDATQDPKRFIGDGIIKESSNCIHADPKFVDSAKGNYRLQPGSPCIDKGNNAHISKKVTTDLDCKPRIVNGTVDIGVYEHRPP